MDTLKIIPGLSEKKSHRDVRRALITIARKFRALDSQPCAIGLSTRALSPRDSFSLPRSIDQTR
ncbi:MAG TPA: hypothetical protein EYN14_08270 [Alphaproteobacteria bacterium]|nr:hypothetical protein [Alphaproteobacteria bacterium]